jgi:peptide/nickel transport system substrate-binding protein
VKRLGRTVAGLLLAAVAASAPAACGSGSPSTSSSQNRGGVGSASDDLGASGTVYMVAGAFPGSLDPGVDDTTQGAEVNWLVYTGLTTYRHASGIQGEQLQPGLATALPGISHGGRTYTVTLRRGLEFSDGTPVKASDFTFALERALRIPWRGSREFLSPVIVGADAYATGRAASISGVATDNATGRIVIELTAPDGAFDNVLAEPALGLIPTGSAPFAKDPLHPPPGDGPYVVRNIVPGQSYSVVRNPTWKPLRGIPAGHVDIDVRVSRDVASNAEAVLNNTADIFDSSDTVPARLLATIHAKAADRFRLVDLGGSVDYFFLNSREKPFSRQLAREAVVTGLDETAYDREDSGALAPGCFLLPPAVAGHPTGSCPYGTPGAGRRAIARALVRRSGMTGQPVTVWSPAHGPRRRWSATFTRYLSRLGFRAVLKPIDDDAYFQMIGDRRLHPQTGFADWNQGFPNPIDFYQGLLDGHSIRSTANENLGEVDDPHIDSEVSRLSATPTSELQHDATAWQLLDEYTAHKAYVAVFGYGRDPFFASTRMDYPALEMNPIYGWDYTSFQLK